MQPFVEAQLKYIHPDCDGGVLYELDRQSSTLVFEDHPVRIHDARRAQEPFEIDRHGFTLVRHSTDVDLLDNEAVVSRYRPQMEGLVRALTGASEVLSIGEVVRSNTTAKTDTTRGKPAFGAHIDFDQETVAGFVRAFRPDAEALLNRRYALINLWRPIAPVERTPLALCDASSIAREDLREGHIRMRPDEPMPLRMSGFNVAYSPSHRWWFVPRMQPDEVLVFRLFDTDPDAAQWTAHTAFELPGTPEDAPPRRSIESRTIAFFD